jgi:hypothetical protein
MVMGFGISGMGFWRTVGGGRVTWWMGWGFAGLLSGLCGLLGWVVVLVGLCGARDVVTVCPAFLVLSLWDDGIWVFGWSFGGDNGGAGTASRVSFWDGGG